MRKPTMSQIRERNIANGGHFFDRATLRGNGETVKSFRLIREEGKSYIERKRTGSRWRVDEKTGRVI